MTNVFHLMRKDLLIPTKKQGAPRGKKAEAVLRYTEHLKTVSEWPFPPILVAAQMKVNKKDKSEKPTGKWAVLGGTQRVSAANEVKWANPIPAIVFTGQEVPDDKWASSAYVASVRDNMKHGQPFTETERDDSFKEMRTMGMSVQEIANEWHVHKSTVSRSLSGKTTVAAREATAKPETEKTETEGTEKNGKGAQDVKHFCDFLKARYDDVFEFLSSDDESVKEYTTLVFRLAEALNG